MQRGNFLRREGTAHCEVWDSAISCAKTAEPIEMQFWMLSQVGPGNHVLDGVHIGATCRILLNRSCAAAMRPYVKLL